MVVCTRTPISVYLAVTTTCVLGVGLTSGADNKFPLPLVKIEIEGTSATNINTVTTPSRREHLPYLREIYIVQVPVTPTAGSLEGESTRPQIALWHQDHDWGQL